MTSAPRISRARRVAGVLLDLYPRRWRLRYGIEMHAMVEALPVAWRQVVDLGVGAAREWLSPRALGWPARSAAGRVLAMRGMMFISAVILFDVLAHFVVERGSPRVDLSLLEPIVVVLMIAGLARTALGFWHATTTRFGWLARQRWLASVRTTEMAFWIGALGLWLVWVHAMPVSSYSSHPGLRIFTWHLNSLYFASFLHRASERSQRLRRVEFSHVRRAGRTMERELFKLPSRLGKP